MSIQERDVFFMKQALVLAQEAFEKKEVPIGALVVSANSEVLGKGYNVVEAHYSQSRHAEVVAIEHAGMTTKDWRLEQATLYVTVEPCMMCISLCALSRIERVVFGARSPLFGFHLDKEGVLCVYTKQIKNISEGVLAEESLCLLRAFFDRERE